MQPPTRHGTALLLCLLFLCAAAPAAAQYRSAAIDSTAAAQQGEIVYLLNADHSTYDKKVNPDAILLVDNVQMRHDSLYMYCDTAWFYQSENSFEAFGNVRAQQGDTLFLYGDYMHYDGNARVARVRRNVRLINNASVLETDSLDYDRNWNLGYYFDGGTLYNGDDTLTSDWGEYNTLSKDAHFNFDVNLHTPDFELTSDTLHYNTATRIAHVTGPSQIVRPDLQIDTDDGYYHIADDRFFLLNRSVVTNREKRFVADSIFYDRRAGYIEAFDDMLFTDTLNKNVLTGDYGYYNELLDSAYATRRAVALDYSQGDTLHVHGDTIMMHTVHYTYKVPLPQAAARPADSLSLDSLPAPAADSLTVDSLYRLVRVFNKVRAYRSDMQAVCDSMVFDSRDSTLVMYGDPILWNNGQQLLGEQITFYTDSNTIDHILVERQTLFVQQISPTHFNQISGNKMTYYFVSGEIDHADVEGNVRIVYYPQEEKDSTLIGMNTAESSRLSIYMQERQVERILIPSSVSGTMYPMTDLPADKMKLKNFAWFDYIRPRDKNDILQWRGKKSEDKLVVVERKAVPLPTLNKK